MILRFEEGKGYLFNIREIINTKVPLQFGQLVINNICINFSLKSWNIKIYLHLEWGLPTKCWIPWIRLWLIFQASVKIVPSFLYVVYLMPLPPVFWRIHPSPQLVFPSAIMCISKEDNLRDILSPILAFDNPTTYNKIYRSE